MSILRKVSRRLRRMWHGEDRYTHDKWGLQERVEYLEQVVEYLQWQSSRQSTLLRHVAAPVLSELPAVRNTKASFDFQWAEVSSGVAMLDDAAFRSQAVKFVTDFTGLAAEWFRGKRVFDVGCGNGRYSWALCTLGAEVLSLDQSEHGLRRTAEACSAFPSHRTRKVDLLQPLAVEQTADLVWTFGVLHHTGNTYAAFRNVVPLVKPGGYLYMMIYGEPRRYVVDDYEELNEYEQWRHDTMNLGLPEKLEAIRQGMKARRFRVHDDSYIHGYFDAIAPPINDLYTFAELESWLLDAGFSDIRRTVNARNHHVVARRLSVDGRDAAP